MIQIPPPMALVVVAVLQILAQAVIKMSLRFALVAYLSILSGCAASPKYAVLDADENMVKSCVFVESVSGTSGVGGLFASQGVSSAKNEAKSQAASAGATHIVWSSVSGGMTASVSGNAYRCSK
ncbi:MAG: hypothetical protein PHV54_01600 [Tolumonas sp.]|nr:hypothetical protein [Tolumonas sp.]